jgi:hypothetical protein
LWPYLITFELSDKERFGPALRSVLSDLGAVRLTNEAWLLTSDWNACAILEQLRPIVGEGDRLLVLELGEDLAALNIAQPPALWEKSVSFQRTPAQKVN